MPIYAYICKQCDHEFDALQRISDDPLNECPKCHQLSLKKKLTAAAFQLKGNGWYVTDFKDKKKDAGSSGSTSSSSSAEASTSKTQESNSATVKPTVSNTSDKT